MGASAVSPARRSDQHPGPRRPREIIQAQSVLAPRPYAARPHVRVAEPAQYSLPGSRAGTSIATDVLIKTSARKPRALFRFLQPDLLRLSLIAVLLGAIGWCAVLYNQLRSPALVAPALAAVYPPASEPLKAALLTHAAHLQQLADLSDETSSIHVKSMSSGMAGAVLNIAG